jgi:hypothetical protein
MVASMTVETQVSQSTFQSASGDGIHEVVLGAAGAIMGADLDSPGLLQIQPVEQSGGSSLWLGIEAAFAEGVGERVISKLDVRVRQQVEEVPLGLVRDGLAELGGARFTNVCVGPPPSPDDQASREDVLDVTVTFPSWVPVLASNQALVGDSLDAADRELCRAVLRALGVWFAEAGGKLRVRPWQLRGPMQPSAQLAAFQVAASGERRASIYSAILPPSSSVRVERGVTLVQGARKPYVDVCLSRGLASTEATTAAEARVMQELFRRHLGVDFGGRDYRVSSCRWSVPPPDPKPKVGIRMPWSRG